MGFRRPPPPQPTPPRRNPPLHRDCPRHGRRLSLVQECLRNSRPFRLDHAAHNLLMALLDLLTGRANDASESEIFCCRLETATAGALLWSALDTSTVVAMCAGDYSRTGFVSAHACPARVVLPTAVVCLRPRLRMCVATRRLRCRPPGSGLGPARAHPGRQVRASGWGFIRGVTRQLFGAGQMRSGDERRPIDF